MAATKMQVQEGRQQKAHTSWRKVLTWTWDILWSLAMDPGTALWNWYYVIVIVIQDSRKLDETIEFFVQEISGSLGGGDHITTLSM